jgi:hypothetical protein
MRHRTPRRWAALLVVGAVASATGCRSEAPVAADDPIERVLVVTMPGVTWKAARAADLPVLDAFVREAAVGDLATRIGRRRASTTDAYLTIGAGTRAVAPVVDVAVALDPDELYGGLASREILDRRLGAVPSGIAYLAAGAAIDANDHSPYGAQVGLLGDSLAAAGIDRAVIANADAAEGFVSDEPPPDGAYARGAATALMGSDGVVPAGTVGRGLLRDDPDAPFGRRLDHDAVLAAFDQVWTDSPRVVLVEASDLSRASGYGPRATADQRRALTDDALASSDALLAALLDRVDPEHDAVLVLSPVAPSSSPDLAVVALRAPGVEPGVLRSATTRRDGYVQLADVAPTVLTLLGEDVPGGIEGRPFGVRARAGEDRVEGLIEAADAAAFRDEVLPTVVTLVIVALAILCLATWQRRRLPPWAAAALRPAALAALGIVPATFLIGRLQSTVGEAGRFALGLLAIAAAIGGVATLVERRWSGLGAVTALGAIVAMFLVDVSLGAPLQLNTVFGYSLSVAGRFAGVGNLAFALFGAATILLATLVADRWGSAGVRAAVVLLAVVVVVEGLPMLGADVGGVLSMVPAFGLTAMVLAGRRPRPLHLAILAGLGAVAVLGFAALDLARPEDSRTHLGRVAADALDGRWSTLGDSLSRRWQASFGGAETTGWLLVGILLVVGVAYAVAVARGWLGPDAPPRRQDVPARAAMAGLGVLAAVGLVANDSSIAVPTTMLIVVAPIAVLQALAGRPAIGPRLDAPGLEA